MGPFAGELVGIDEVVVQPPAAIAERIRDADDFFARRIDPITGNDYKMPAPAIPGDSRGILGVNGASFIYFTTSL